MATGTIKKFVNAAGDTMTGTLINTRNYQRKNTDIAIGDAVSGSTVYGGYHVMDKNGISTGWFETWARPDKASLTRIAARTANASGNDINNMLDLTANSDGTMAVTVTNQAAWRKGLGLGTNGAFPIPVAQGGTGATTAANARTQLGVNGCLKAKLVTKSSGDTIQAYSSVTIETGVERTTDSFFAGSYAGNPSCVITNIFTRDNKICATVFNPTNAAKTLNTASGQEVRIIELYPV